MIDDKIYSIIFLAVVHLIVIFLFLFFVLRIVYFFFKRTSRNRAEKFFAVAITCLLFNKTIREVIVSPVKRLVNNLENLFYLFYEYNAVRVGSPEQQDVLENHPLNQSVVSVSSIFNDYSFTNLITAIAAAIILYYVILLVVRNVPAPTAGQTVNSAFLYNLFITGILAISLFFVISVFITIPYLNESRKPSIFTKERLEETFTKRASTDSIVISIGTGPFFDSTANYAVLGNDNTASDAYAHLSDDDRHTIDGYLQKLQAVNDQYNEQRDLAITSIEKYVKDYPAKKQQFRLKLVSQFEAASQSLMMDKSAMYQYCVNTYENFIESENYELKNAVNIIAYKDAENETTKQEYINDVKYQVSILSKKPGLPKPLSGPGHNNPIQYSDVPFYNKSPFLSYSSFEPQKDFDTYINTFIKDGSEWGIFGVMSRYLIRTESLELTLLIGMIGFGLLGASILSFDKNPSGKNFVHYFRSEPLIANFGSVLARGFGAALIVYLATKGSLAIFSLGNTNDPNGYILLLTCFIGAVFSESIWDKASGWMPKRGGEANGTDTSGNASGSNPTGGGLENAPASPPLSPPYS